MTNSLLERLNHWRMECVGIQDADALMKEAADEIARLQRDLADCTESHQRTNAKFAELEDDAELLSELHGLFTLCANTTGDEFKAARTKLYKTLSEIPERMADSAADEPKAHRWQWQCRECGEGFIERQAADDHLFSSPGCFRDPADSPIVGLSENRTAPHD